MKKCDKKSRHLIIIITLVLIVDIILLILTIEKHIFESKAFVIKRTTTNNGVVLNKSIYYVAYNERIILDISNPNDVEYEIVINDLNVVNKENNELVAKNIGYTDFALKINGFTSYAGRIYVLKGLEIVKEQFNKSKKIINCNSFTKEENDLLDKALEDRIASAGYKTRAGVVEAARFLTLEFGFKIPYFYENGRLNNYGSGRKVDGEGRYYHKGLYLNETRYENITNKFTGPGTWGCKITQYQEAPSYGFVSGNKYPNGLDCSGFISWVLLNGGFDVGDVGAGDIISRKDDLYDLGEKNLINDELLESSKVKVGDLIAYSGHMAIIVGIDGERNYYVTESLPQFKGVVINKYDKSKLKNTFTHIMLMDSVYNSDGNLTNMWY